MLVDSRIGEENTLRMLEVLKREKCRLIASGFPDFIFAFKDRFPGLQKGAYRGLFQCELPPKPVGE